jgi:hypothetical protein
VRSPYLVSAGRTHSRRERPDKAVVVRLRQAPKARSVVDVSHEVASRAERRHQLLSESLDPHAFELPDATYKPSPGGEVDGNVIANRRSGVLLARSVPASPAVSESGWRGLKLTEVVYIRGLL